VSRYRPIQSAFRRVTHQRPRRRRRRRVYSGPFRNNPENNGVDQIVTRLVSGHRVVKLYDWECLASQWPRVTDFSGLSAYTGSRPKEKR